MRRRIPSFDALEGRKLLSGTQYDPNYDLETGWVTVVDPSLGAVPAMPPPSPTIVYPFPGPAPYDTTATQYPL